MHLSIQPFESCLVSFYTSSLKFKLSVCTKVVMDANSFSYENMDKGATLQLLILHIFVRVSTCIKSP